MIVKELVALFGVKTDMASVKKADGAMNGLTSSLVGMAGRFVSITAVIAGAWKSVRLAASVQEMENVLNIAFRENRDVIDNWADSFSKAAGRSKYELREMAAGLGAFLTPMLKDNAELSADLSQQLSEVAVDLGSVYEAADTDVMAAIQSGLSGMALPLRRFGIDLTEVALQEYALANGINKRVKAMNNAEKAELRARYIIEKAYLAKGDAIKTEGSFANRLKRTAGLVKDTAIEFGKQLIPGLTDFLGVLVDLLPTIKSILFGLGRFFNILLKVGKGIYTLAKTYPQLLGIAAVVAMFLNWNKVMGATHKIFGMLAKHPILIFISLLVLVIEDLLVWVEGGNSLFGKWIEKLDEITGLPISEFIKDTIKWFKKLFTDPTEALYELETKLSRFWEDLKMAFKMTWTEIKDWFWNLMFEIESFFSKIWNEKIIGPMKDSWNWVRGLFGGEAEVTRKSVFSPGMLKSGSAGGNVNNSKTDIKIDIKGAPGMDEAKLAQMTAKHVKKEIDAQNRATMRSFAKAAG